MAQRARAFDHLFDAIQRGIRNLQFGFCESQIFRELTGFVTFRVQPHNIGGRNGIVGRRSHFLAGRYLVLRVLQAILAECQIAQQRLIVHAFSNSHLLSSDSERYLQEFVDCLEHSRRSLVRTLELHNLNAFLRFCSCASN